MGEIAPCVTRQLTRCDTRAHPRPDRQGGLAEGPNNVVSPPTKPSLTVGPRSSSRGPLLPDERDPVLVHFLRVREEVAPHSRRGGEVRQRTAERLDHEPAVVPGPLHRLERL